ncbi:MAG: class I SAM-dependent methyltransferase, partial [Vulcanimicrobiaceae bacterium]
LDANGAVLCVAKELAGGDPEIAFQHADGTKLPFEDASFDVAMCNLTLHHLAPEAATVLLRELRRVSHVAPIVTDLVRSPLSWFAALCFALLFSRNRLTRHDAPLSARRAYTPTEVLELARSAGWTAPRVTRFGLIRMVLTDGA